MFGDLNAELMQEPDIIDQQMDKSESNYTHSCDDEEEYEEELEDEISHLSQKIS